MKTKTEPWGLSPAEMEILCIALAMRPLNIVGNMRRRALERLPRAA